MTTSYYKKQKQRYEQRRNQTRFTFRQRKLSCIHERVTTPPCSVAMGWNIINGSASKDHYYYVDAAVGSTLEAYKPSGRGSAIERVAEN